MTCSPPDACHQPGICNPSTGLCDSPPTKDGTACSDGNACTNTDTCQGGVCTPGTDVVCHPLDQCREAGVCGPTTGACTNPPKADGTPCDDNDHCTVNDACVAGVCTGKARDCSRSDGPCTVGHCNELTGGCEPAFLDDDTPCDDVGDLCTEASVCRSGTCLPGPRRDCPPFGPCVQASCDSASGQCVETPLADGTSYEDGDRCILGDVCIAGTCVAGQRLDCPALDLCYGVGACNPQTGVCSAPFLPQGASCPTGSPCAVGTCDGAGTCVATPVNEGGACAGGVCAGGACCTPTTCQAQGAICGTIPDGCGGTLDCGCCPRGCNGRCGTVADGCGGTIFCGSCGGCFIAGTRVAMADGSSRPIELITIGDRVLGRDGRVNRVVGLARPILGDRQLFALNGGVPFVTAGHPFLTPEGRKSIDPVASAAEVPGLPISRLAGGDRLLSLTPAAVPMLVGGPEFEDGLDAQQAPVPLRSVVGWAASPTTQLFNLVVDGNHTYFADDLLVHNKPSK